MNEAAHLPDKKLWNRKIFKISENLSIFQIIKLYPPERKDSG
jgi:hypothetical protein